MNCNLEDYIDIHSFPDPFTCPLFPLPAFFLPPSLLWASSWGGTGSLGWGGAAWDMLGVLVFRLSLAFSKLGDLGHSSASTSLSFSCFLGQMGTGIVTA